MHNLTITFAGYGQYLLTTTHYNKAISCHSTNSKDVDDARDGKKSAIKNLRNEIILKSKLWK